MHRQGSNLRQPHCTRQLRLISSSRRGSVPRTQATIPCTSKGQHDIISNSRFRNKLLPIPVTLSASEVRSRYNTASLAFLGDAVWETFVRQHYFGSGRQPLHAYNLAVKSHTSAAQQALYFDLMADPGGIPADSETHASETSEEVTAAVPPRSPPHTAAAADSAALAGEAAADSQAMVKLQTGDAALGQINAALLTEEERDILRWARNSSAISPPRGMDSLQYKKATALEVLVAFLFLTDLPRCHAVMQLLLAPVNT